MNIRNMNIPRPEFPRPQLVRDTWMNLNDNGWGYGTAPKTEEEYKERFRGLADAMLDNDRIFGLCYTQLYDVEQEQNGLYTYERKPKFDTNIFAEILKRKAKIEE